MQADLMSDIILSVEGPVAILTLNRPAKRNAMNLSMWAAIPELVKQAYDQQVVRLLIISGSGDHFSAGADIAELPKAYASKDQAVANQSLMLEAMAAIEGSSLPTLALINGFCVGGGCGLALACDFRWATPEAQFAITPAKLGLAYGIADTRRLVQAVGVSRTKQILFTGAKADAQTALAWGLIDEVYDQAAMAEAISSLAQTLAGSARFSIKASKHMISRVVAGASVDDANSQAFFASAFDGDDFKEGFAAFMAKDRRSFDETIGAKGQGSRSSWRGGSTWFSGRDTSVAATVVDPTGLLDRPNWHWLTLSRTGPHQYCDHRRAR
jgi:enoyl-CoA hydratase/carnithine racemase